MRQPRVEAEQANAAKTEFLAMMSHELRTPLNAIGGYRPTTFADPRNTFHEKAMLCRAAENSCYFASVNCASDGSPATSAVVAPDGTVLAWQPYGKEGLLVADVDTTAATGLLATRCRSA